MPESAEKQWRPRDLAIVWGTAFVQLSQLWRAGIRLLLEAGSAESAILGEQTDQLVVPRAAMNGLRACEMTGETYGKQLPERAVKFEPMRIDDDRALMTATVDDDLLPPALPGDIYRGHVLDASGNKVGRIALDAGS